MTAPIDLMRHAAAIAAETAANLADAGVSECGVPRSDERRTTPHRERDVTYENFEPGLTGMSSTDPRPRRRPRILDLFCCAGGAARGYADAGWDVYGVDNKPRKNYPYAFHLGDALDVMRRLLVGEAIPFTHKDGTIEWLTLADFDAIHASPPCQAYSVTRHTNDKEHPDLVEPTREAVIATGLPYIIENVEGAPLLEPLLLCGSMFGLKAIDVDGERLALQRHRLFESNVFLMSAGGCAHDGDQVAGVYGGGRHRNVSDRENPKRRGGYTPLGSVRKDLMGIDWMTQWELTQAIPPAYTEFLGLQMIEHLAVTS